MVIYGIYASPGNKSSERLPKKGSTPELDWQEPGEENISPKTFVRLNFLALSLVPIRLRTQTANHLPQLPDPVLQLPNLHHRRVNLDIRPRSLNLLIPSLTFKINLPLHLLPLLRRIVIGFAARAVQPHCLRPAGLDERGDA